MIKHENIKAMIGLVRFRLQENCVHEYVRIGGKEILRRQMTLGPIVAT